MATRFNWVSNQCLQILQEASSCWHNEWHTLKVNSHKLKKCSLTQHIIDLHVSLIPPPTLYVVCNFTYVTRACFYPSPFHPLRCFTWTGTTSIHTYTYILSPYCSFWLQLHWFYICKYASESFSSPSLHPVCWYYFNCTFTYLTPSWIFFRFLLHSTYDVAQFFLQLSTKCQWKFPCTCNDASFSI